jgi:hypothetical protein
VSFGDAHDVGGVDAGGAAGTAVPMITEALTAVYRNAPRKPHRQIGGLSTGVAASLVRSKLVLSRHWGAP